MEEGHDFLKAQVNNAVAQHNEFVKALESHEDQADDPRYRDLCARYYPKMRAHQEMLEQYQKEIGAGEGALKKAVGATLGAARNLADMGRENDFLRLVNDIVMSRQSEDTFKTFRDAGRELGETRLAEIGEICEAEHDNYARDANMLIKNMFVENVRGGKQAMKDTTRRVDDMPETRF